MVYIKSFRLILLVCVLSCNSGKFNKSSSWHKQYRETEATKAYLEPLSNDVKK